MTSARRLPLRRGPSPRSIPTRGNCSVRYKTSSWRTEISQTRYVLRLRSFRKPDNPPLLQAAKAFVSAVRAYSKHEAAYIFRLRELDVFGMGTAFGLLRLPRMPEIRDWKDRVAKAKERAEKGKALDGDERLTGSTWEDREINVSNLAPSCESC